MLGGGKTRVFFYTGPCDMRRQMNGLATMVREEMQQAPESGDLFVFRNRRRDMVKVLFFDELGCCLLCKRLHKGAFRIALDDAGDVVSIEISQGELATLLAKAEIAKRAASSA